MKQTTTRDGERCGRGDFCQIRALLEIKKKKKKPSEVTFSSNKRRKQKQEGKRARGQESSNTGCTSYLKIMSAPLPHHLAAESVDYGSINYWTARYHALLPHQHIEYDWYMDVDHLLKHFLLPLLPRSKQAEILIPGCGSSKLGAALFALGYENISNVDLCTAVIEHMNQHKGASSSMEFAVMDARQLDGVPDGCFDLIVDKGLMDALLCSETNATDVGRMVDEMHRVLASGGGTYVVVSHSAPSSRLQHLQRAWAVAVEHLDGGFHMYVCRKQ